MGRITLIEGDITDQGVDALVNAANADLWLGSGVAGAIRERGGPTIQAECDAHGPIEVGGAAVTGAGDLSARWVIHAASMERAGASSEESVRASLRASFDAAAALGARTLAVPAIGAGVGGLGLQRCAEISLEEAHRALGAHAELDEIRFVLFGEPAYRLFEMVQDAAKVAAQMERLKKR
jgi:O-acetyl-ADP-ribose deacetylase (regulator of RNase III)